jgi:hypothetical protein
VARRWIALIAAILALSVAAIAHGYRSEISVQATGFFTRNTDGNGIAQRTTNSGGFWRVISSISTGGMRSR